ncbi:hypothetical protein BCR37DRAFT_400477 [Protomyces lactucae-debilis]|uniref:Peroxin 20 n=1 Tax=Protomyces lactucae-debilis TaxID=2754530 RepID=A0A1Y2F1Q2_PROLT|nr:uncharacterized protein BCR37DRAFT_400477 [Protomyces lactucae-debilis]ORY77763.1 hypothetical protein BCR37DRAFT_400477 [Protomyces lactucae-debilis]
MDSCGPSNGAKSLQRHFAQDRSLQQDTARSKHASTSTCPAGFRQHEEQTLHQADAAMQAFQQGREVGPLVRRMPMMGQSAPLPVMQQQQQQQHAQSHAWTGDFERQQQQGKSQNGPGAQITGAWGADFLAFQQQQQQSQQSQWQGVQPMMGMGTGMMSHVMHPPSMMQSSGMLQNGPARTMDLRPQEDQAFTDAFAQAERSVAGLALDQQDAHAAMHQQGHEEGLVFANQNEAVDHMTRQEGPVSAEEHRAVEQSMENAALSRIAGDLINAVAADQEQRGEVASGGGERQLSAAMTDKFRNSNFMKLMHALRDGQVALTQDGQGLADTVTGEEVSVAEPAVQVPALTEEDHKQIEEQRRRRGEPIYGSKYTFDDSLEAMNDELALSM